MLISLSAVLTALQPCRQLAAWPLWDTRWQFLVPSGSLGAHLAASGSHLEDVRGLWCSAWQQPQLIATMAMRSLIYSLAASGSKPGSMLTCISANPLHGNHCCTPWHILAVTLTCSGKLWPGPWPMLTVASS